MSPRGDLRMPSDACARIWMEKIKEDQSLASGKIDYRFKIIYALGTIFVVAGHCDNGGISLLFDWFPPYAFHLGLFVFASGYFYKNRSEAHITQYICKK